MKMNRLVASSPRGSVIQREPTIYSQPVAQLQRGETAGRPTGNTKRDNCDTTWYELETPDGQLGWIKETVVNVVPEDQDDPTPADQPVQYPELTPVREPVLEQYDDITPAKKPVLPEDQYTVPTENRQPTTDNQQQNPPPRPMYPTDNGQPTTENRTNPEPRTSTMKLQSYQVNFIDKAYPYALQIEKSHGIPAVVAIAQAALETGWGGSAPGNMLFGMKATGKSYGGWKGKKQLLTTTEYHTSPNVPYPQVISVTPVAGGKYKYRVKDYFRAYDTIGDSFKDYAGLLKSVPGYAPAFKHSDPDKFIDAIAAGGYATSPTYASTLKSVKDSIEIAITDKKNASLATGEKKNNLLRNVGIGIAGGTLLLMAFPPDEKKKKKARR